MSRRITRLVVAFGFGLAVSLYAWQRLTDPQPAIERAKEEAVVVAARGILRGYLDAGEELRIVDPLAPERAVGKVYIYPANSGWEVSGHYQRNPADRWHPYLMHLDSASALVELSVGDDDPRLRRKAAEDPRLIATP